LRRTSRSCVALSRYRYDPAQIVPAREAQCINCYVTSLNPATAKW